MVTKTKTVYLRTPGYKNSSSFNTNSVSPRLVTLARSRTGNALKNWKTFIRANLSATTSLVASSENLSWEEGRAYVSATNDFLDPMTGKYVTSSSDFTGLYSDPNSEIINPPSANVTSATNQALTRLHQALRDQTTHFQGGVFIGEFKESVKTVRNIASKFAGLIPGYLAKQQKTIVSYLGEVAFRPNGSMYRVNKDGALGRLKRPKRLTPNQWAEFRKKIADNWLEFSFGVRPLLGDAHDAAEAVARYANDSQHTRIRGFGTSTTGATNTLSTGGSLTNFYAYKTTRDKVEVKVIYRAGLQFALNSPAFGSAERMRGLFGFKLEDFVPTIWNLLPYSWLIDYFVNVGDLLECLTTDTSSVRWVQRTIVQARIREITVRAEPYPNTPTKAYSGGGSLGRFRKEYVTVDRQSTAFDIPTPEIKIPGFTGHDGAFNQQLLNILAVLQNGSGHRRGF
jgi:hypothetical protein